MNITLLVGEIKMKSCIELCSDYNGKISAVNYLKGFSIFTIALMHLLGFITELPKIILTMSSIGGTGAHVFFLCSVIGLDTSYLKHKQSYFEFLKKRFFKIYIPYIIIILMAFFTPWLYYGDNRLTALLSHIFLFKMFSPMYEVSFGVPFWFISTIFQFYILFIPMCWIKDKLKNNKIFFLIFLGLSVIWWIFCYCFGISEIRCWGSFCLQYIWEFALGFILAEYFFYNKKIIINNFVLIVFAILGIGLQTVLALCSDVLKGFNDIPALIGYTSLALLLGNISFINKLFQKLSSFSYEFYLIHTLVFAAIFHLLQPEGLLIQCFVSVGAMIIALGTSYFYNRVIKKIKIV